MDYRRIAQMLRHITPTGSTPPPLPTPAAAAPELQTERYMTYDELTSVCRSVTDAYPGLCALDSIGTSREGRELWLLTLTDTATGAAAEKPAYFIYGNIHASEPTGAHAAVYNAMHLLAEERELLKSITVYIVPRVSVDGAEYCVTTGGRVRSRKWDAAGEFRSPNTVYPDDINGDGWVVDMRIEHPSGTFVADAKEPRLLVPRQVDSPPPYYKVLPEGLIHDWDGSDDIRSAGTSDIDGGLQGDKNPRTWDGVDFNRQSKFHSEKLSRDEGQNGSGDFPFSELEMRHLITFLHSHPKIFGIMGYHTGIYCVLRLGSQPAANAAIDESDDATIERLVQTFAQQFPSVCDGSAEMGIPGVAPTKLHPDGVRDTSYHGHSFDSFYYHLGVLGFEVELGIAENVVMSGEESIALSNGPNPDGSGGEERLSYTRQLLRHWDATGQKEPLFVDWKPYTHPQLGEVEVGGLMETMHMNPMMATMGPIMAGCHASILHHAKQHPTAAVEALEADACGGGVWRVRATVGNRGALPTHVTQKGLSLGRFAPVVATLAPAEGVKLLSQAGHVELGHLPAVVGTAGAEWFVQAPAGGVLGTLKVLGAAGGDSEVVVVAG